MNIRQSQSNSNKPVSRLTIGFLVFLLMGGYLLWSEHQAHVLQALPWLILLACPLLHVFMHRGHDQEKRDE